MTDAKDLYMFLLYVFFGILFFSLFISAIHIAFFLYVHFKLIFKYGDDLKKIMKNAYYYGEIGVGFKKRRQFRKELYEMIENDSPYLSFINKYILWYLKKTRKAFLIYFVIWFIYFIILSGLFLICGK